MITKYIDKEISMLARMEQLEAISQQGLDKLKEFRRLRDLAKGLSFPTDSVGGCLLAEAKNKIKLLEACRYYDATGEDRPDGYIVADCYTAKRQDGL